MMNNLVLYSNGEGGRSRAISTILIESTFQRLTVGGPVNGIVEQEDQELKKRKIKAKKLNPRMMAVLEPEHPDQGQEDKTVAPR